MSADTLTGTSNVRHLLRGLRQLVGDIEAQGHDWRDAIAGLRASTPRLWEQLPERERRRFLRHLQPWWDTHRHRCAPQASAQLQALVARGDVNVRAARMLSVQAAAGTGWAVAWQPRGSEQVRAEHVDWVVNCTGPSSDLRSIDRSIDPLWHQLVNSGAARPDPLGLGVCAGPDYRLDATTPDSTSQPSRSRGLARRTCAPRGQAKPAASSSR